MNKIAKMKYDSKIYIAGHNGIVGFALVQELKRQGYHNLILRSSKELDLRRQEAVEQFFDEEKPEFVFLAAAKVGGILANSQYPADFMYDNMMIEMNVIRSAFCHQVLKLLFLGSSCIYPKLAPQPIKEDYLLTSELEQTNEAYALAKIAGLKYCEYLNRQYGTDFISVMPTNLFGPNDNYHVENSHVIPGMIRKFHEAKESYAKKVVVWGTGTPKREFLYVDDLANACVYLMNHYKGNETVNVGTGKEITIAELANIIKEVVGFKGVIEYDTSKPDGTPRKLLNIDKLFRMGWAPQQKLKRGLALAYKDFLESTNQPISTKNMKH